MNPFAYARAKSYDDVGRLLDDDRYELPVLKAGGMDVVDHLKEGLESPDLIIDISRVRRPQAGASISKRDDLIAIEATATLAEIAESSIMRESAAAVATAAEAAATPQVRNVATAAGNLLQRPRCWYYRRLDFHCLKKGGPVCYAAEGENKYHAILGGGPCHIVHPSNLAPTLYVSGGVLHLTGGERTTVPIEDLYHGPLDGIRSEHDLEFGEVVTHITLKAQTHSGFYLVKEKQSNDWPLVMAAVGLDLDGSRIKGARVCAGAVAPVPWPLPNVEAALRGVDLDDDAALRKACERSVDGAAPLSDNAYKKRLLPVAVRRAVLAAAGRPVQEA